MTILDFFAAVTLAGAVIYVLASAAKGGELRLPWIVPAILSLAFLAFSLVTIAQEGLFGFWANHTEDLWGLQVWMDLLFAVAISWTFLVPEARKQDMAILPWGILVVCTASIGLWAMMARVLYLRERSAPALPA